MPLLQPTPLHPILYSFRRCPYAMRARFAIAIADQACELREVVLRDKPAELLAAFSDVPDFPQDGKATVPVLIDRDGRVIAQSLDIMLWALQRHDPEQWLQPAHGTLDDMLALIARCDGDFKQQLDRYKYPARQPDIDASAPADHRAQAAHFLDLLNQRLRATRYLFGARVALADMAMAPFVRQFAQVDPAWFAAQPWPALQGWLAALTSSALWLAATHKYPPWKTGEAGIVFPPPALGLS